MKKHVNPFRRIAPPARLIPFFVLVLFLSPILDTYAQDNSGEYMEVPFNLSIVPGISIGDYVASDADVKIVNQVSFNVLMGRAARLEGAEFGYIWNWYTEYAHGVQFAGIGNTVQGDLVGGQWAGLINMVGKRARGGQWAGLLNMVGGEMKGAQAAGIGNMIGGSLQGVQAAGIFGLTGGTLHGAQLTGIAGITGGEVRGLQAAGITNVVGGDITGAQISSIVNVAGGDVHGVQISAVSNIADHVHGAQIGLFNYAKRNDGVPIGLVSYVENIGVRLDVWGDETGFLHTGIRSGNRRVSNFLSFGSRPVGSDDYQYAVGFGLGVEFPIRNRVFGTADLMAFALSDHSTEDAHSALAKFRLTAGFNVSDYFAVFAGPAFNVFVSDEFDGRDLSRWTVYETTVDNTYVRMWPGLVFGIRLYSKR